MNVLYEKDRFTKRLRAKKAEQLLPYDLGDLLIGALERELSEPLEDPKFDDVPEEQKQRMRETGF